MQIIRALFARMDLRQLETFLHVFREGNFASAASGLNVAPSSVSRSIAGLERELGVRLFHRTTRLLSPTEAGEAYFDHVAPLLEELKVAGLKAADVSKGPSGQLRVTASVSFGETVIAPRIHRFCDAFPDIKIDIVLSDERIDLIEAQIDVAIRHGELDDSSFIAQKLLPVRYHLVASPAYISASPSLRRPSDIPNHTIVSFPFENFRGAWQFESAGLRESVAISPRIITGNAATLAAIARSGAGLALLADWLIASDLRRGSLVDVLPGWTVTGAISEASIWLVYPSRSYVPLKTRSFIDFLKSDLRDLKPSN